MTRVKWILSCIVITSLEKRWLVALLVFGLWLMYTAHHGLFALPLGVIGRLGSMIVALPERAGLGGSVGCAVRLETRRSRVQPPPRSVTFFHGD